MEILNENKEIDPGDSIIIQQPVKVTKPWEESENLTSVDNATITIKDPDGTAIVDSVDMSEKDSGEYYYVWNSSESLVEGDYEVRIVAGSGDQQAVLDDRFIRLG